MRLEISARANRDIDLIFLHGLDNFGKTQADRYACDLFDLFSLLLINPKMGFERSEFRRKMRSIIFKSHIVFYRIARGKVLIVRVLHGRQNWASHL